MLTSARRNGSDFRLLRVGPGNLQWNKTGITILGTGYGPGADQLAFPGGLFIEPKTQILYVADLSNNRVQKLYPSGEVITAAGQPNGTGGSTADKLWTPVDVFADERENIFVADWNNQRVQYWEKNGKSGKTIAGNGTRGSALNQFSYPSRVLMDSKGKIMVADTQNARITQWPFSFDPTTSTGTIVAVSSVEPLFRRKLFLVSGRERWWYQPVSTEQSSGFISWRNQSDLLHLECKFSFGHSMGDRGLWESKYLCWNSRSTRK